MQQLRVGGDVLLQVVEQDEVDIVKAHVDHETPQRERQVFGYPLRPRRGPGRHDGQGEDNGGENRKNGEEDALRHEHAVIAHLEDQLAHEAYHVVYPLRHLRLGGHGGPLRVVVDGGAEVLHAVDELVPPVGILAQLLDFLRRVYAVLHLAQAGEVFRLFFSNLPLQRRHLLVLGHGHRLGGVFERLAGHLQLTANPCAGGDAHGEADDAEQLHHVHRPAAEHHHPALVGTHAQGEAQSDDTRIAHRTAQDSRFGKALHGHQKLVKALVDGGKTHREQHVGYVHQKSCEHLISFLSFAFAQLWKLKGS